MKKGEIIKIFRLVLQIFVSNPLKCLTYAEFNPVYTRETATGETVWTGATEAIVATGVAIDVKIVRFSRFASGSVGAE